MVKSQKNRKFFQYIWSSLFFRLFLSYFVLLTFFLFFSFVVIKYITSQSIDNALKDSARHVFISMSDVLEVYALTRSPAYLKQAEKIAQIHPYLLSFQLYDDKGQLLASYAKGNYHPPKIKEKRNQYLFVSDFGKVYVVFYQLDFSVDPFLPSMKAFLRLDLSRTYFEEVPRKTSFWIFLGYLLFAVISLVLAFIFSSRFVSPLNSLLEAVKALKQGNFDLRVEQRSGVREIDELIASFNKMALALKMYASELKQSWEQFRIIADFTADWEYWEDHNGRMIYVSPACERITGYPPQRFIDDPDFIEKIILPEDLENWLKHKEEVHRRRRSGPEFEFRIITADGSIKWIAHLCNPVYNEGGVFLGIRGSNRDITYRKELEQQVFQAQKMESIARLAGGIAHDLNNLMTAIMGQAELLKFGLEPQTKHYDRAEKIVEAAQKACELVEKLLDYARGRKFKPEIVNLNQIIRESLRLQETILDGRIDLTLKLDKKLKNIYGDPSQLTQILMNLVINAVEAMKEGGQLYVETKNIRIASPVEDIPPGEYVVLRVKDTGCGMDKEILEKIFEPFFSTKDFGRGLGLAAVFGLVKTHNGYIKVYSKKGKGTLFEIYFPVYNSNFSENLSVEDRPRFDA